MNGEVKIIHDGELPAKATQSSFSQVGDKNTQIAHANNVHHVINIILPGAASSAGGRSLCTDYYNLFVTNRDSFSDGFFTLTRDRVLTEYTSPETAALFDSLGEDEISQIKAFPALFVSENHSYGRTDTDHIAYFGLVTDVKHQENGIKIYFQKLSPIPQQRLNELAFDLAIQGSKSFNELNRTHWSIKKINLIEELKVAGISVLAPT